MSIEVLNRERVLGPGARHPISGPPLLCNEELNKVSYIRGSVQGLGHRKWSVKSRYTNKYQHYAQTFSGGRHKKRGTGATSGNRRMWVGERAADFSVYALFEEFEFFFLPVSVPYVSRILFK